MNADLLTAWHKAVAAYGVPTEFHWNRDGYPYNFTLNGLDVFTINARFIGFVHGTGGKIATLNDGATLNDEGTQRQPTAILEELLGPPPPR
jgi:hypothetical protein